MILFAIVCGIFLSSMAFAQGGRTPGKLIVGATPVAQGEIKFAEEFTTRDGSTMPPGIYRISVNLNTRGEVQFILGPYRVDENSTAKGLEKNAFNTQRKVDPQVYVGGTVTRNLLVKGIASNLEGNFSVQNITPTEAILTFNSKQFAASSVLGRSLDSKLVDLVPVSVGLEEPNDCGSDCIEGYVKVTIRNDGNTPAAGKWNVMILDPQFFVGTITDIPPAGEKSVTSTTRIKLPCCNPAILDANVHSDFYNTASDSNDSNNIKRFTVKLKQ
jgi:hypothetical protein